MKVTYYIYIFLVLFFAKYIVDFISYALWLVQKKIKTSHKKNDCCSPVISGPHG